MPDYLEPSIGPTDPDDLTTDAYDTLSSNIPGYVVNDNTLEAFLIMALAGIVATGMDVASAVPSAIFRAFGRTVVGFQSIDDIAASTGTTWMMVDAAGYTIPQGTFVGFQATGDDVIVFTTDDEVIVPPGSTSTAVGGVSITAVEAGSASNGLDPATIVLLDSLAFVASVTAVGSPAGGLDGEDDATYLSRLAQDFQLFTPTPILAVDAAMLARNVPGVARATAVDNYNPSDGTSTNQRMVAVASIDSGGNAVGTPVKAAVLAYLQSLRETNFIFNVFDATYTTVNVAFTFTSSKGYVDADVKDAAQSAVVDFLNAATWGISEDDTSGTTWENITTVRYNEVIAVLNAVPGLRYVNSLTINGAATDFALSGKVALPVPGSVVGTPS